MIQLKVARTQCNSWSWACILRAMHLAKSCMPDLYSDSALRVQWMSTHTANYLHIQDELQINDSWPQQKVYSSSSQLTHKYFIVDLKPCFKATQQFRDGEKLLEKGSGGRNTQTYTTTLYFLALLHVHSLVISLGASNCLFSTWNYKKQTNKKVERFSYLSVMLCNQKKKNPNA